MGLSPSPMEIVVIVVLALIILGPNKLPEAAKSVGKGFREMRDSFQGAVDGPEEDDDRFDLEALADDEDEEEYDEPELSEAEKKAQARRVSAKGDVDETAVYSEDDSSDTADDHQNEAESSVPSASSSSTERE